MAKRNRPHSTSDVVLSENAEGKLIHNGNEVISASKVTIGDASFFRVCAPNVPGESGGGGGYAYDVADPDGSHRKVIVETLGGQDQQGGGEWKLTVLKRGGQTVDADYFTAIEVHAGETPAESQIEFKFPISAPNFNGGSSSGSGGSSGGTSESGNRQRLESAGGKVVWQLQDDPSHYDPANGKFGALVVYDTHGNIANEAGWTPVAVIPAVGKPVKP